MVKEGQIREYIYSRGAMQIVILGKKLGYYDQHNQEIKFWTVKNLSDGMTYDFEERIIIKNTKTIGD
jgi:hypothetical protein